MAGPYRLTNKAAIAQAWDELTEAGWFGYVTKEYPHGEYALKLTREGYETVDARVGDGLRELASGRRFLVLPLPDFDELFGSE